MITIICVKIDASQRITVKMDEDPKKDSPENDGAVVVYPKPGAGVKAAAEKTDGGANTVVVRCWGRPGAIWGDHSPK